MAQDSKPKKYEDLLMAALQFDEADLTANMAGAWSERQAARMIQRQRDHAVWIIILGVLSLVFTFFFVRICNSIGVVLDSVAALTFMTGLMALAISRSRIAHDLWAIGRDLQSGMREVEGHVQLDTGTKRNKTTYLVKVGGVKLNVKKEEFLTFKNLDPYRLYYAPNQKKILSAEWLRGEAGSVNNSPQEVLAGTSHLEVPDDEAGDDDVVLGDDGELIERKAKTGR